MHEPATTKIAWAEALFDRVRPNWREEAAECGAYWRKTFQTPSERTLKAMREEARIINRAQGARPW